MSTCNYCGIMEDYTDQFVIPVSERVIATACRSCFGKILNGEKLQPKFEPVVQLEFPFMEQEFPTWLWRQWYDETYEYYDPPALCRG